MWPACGHRISVYTKNILDKIYDPQDSFITIEKDWRNLSNSMKFTKFYKILELYLGREKPRNYQKSSIFIYYTFIIFLRTRSYTCLKCRTLVNISCLYLFYFVL